MISGFVGVGVIGYAAAGDIMSSAILLTCAICVIGIFRWLLQNDARFDRLADTWLELAENTLTAQGQAGILGTIDVARPFTLECVHEGMTLLVFQIKQEDQSIVFSSDLTDCRELVEGILGKRWPWASS